MNEAFTFLERLKLGEIFQAVFLIIIGFILAKIVSASLNKAFNKRLTPQQSMLVQRITFYLIFLLFLASSIQQLGFTISALLGATGILTVAIGIASQTSMSNVISGFFIIGEKPFQIGDSIKVNDIQGEVISIDFLSVKIRSTENTMIRIPNETLVKSAITNLSYFPTRRAEFTFNIAYKSDLEIAKKLLLEACTENPLCLNDPKPTVSILEFTDMGISIQLFAWARNEDLTELKNSLQKQVKIAFDKNQINFSTSPHPLFIQAENLFSAQESLNKNN